MAATVGGTSGDWAGMTGVTGDSATGGAGMMASGLATVATDGGGPQTVNGWTGVVTSAAAAADSTAGCRQCVDSGVGSVDWSAASTGVTRGSGATGVWTDGAGSDTAATTGCDPAADPPSALETDTDDAVRSDDHPSPLDALAIAGDAERELIGVDPIERAVVDAR